MEPVSATAVGAAQYMLVNPDTDTVVVYFSVLENRNAIDNDFSRPLVHMMAELAAE